MLVLMEIKVLLNYTRFYEADGPSEWQDSVEPRETMFFLFLYVDMESL